jgi:hypothetical protein
MVKELRLAGVSSIAAANAWLPGFITAYNTRFGRDPANAKDLHRALSRADDLDEILAWREERTVTRNLTLHYDRMMLLLDPTPLARGLAGKKGGEVAPRRVIALPTDAGQRQCLLHPSTPRRTSTRSWPIGRRYGMRRDLDRRLNAIEARRGGPAASIQRRIKAMSDEGTHRGSRADGEAQALRHARGLRRGYDQRHHMVRPHLEGWATGEICVFSHPVRRCRTPVRMSAKGRIAGRRRNPTKGRCRA